VAEAYVPLDPTYLRRLSLVAVKQLSLLVNPMCNF
jgi:hypothetical protein